MNFHKALAQERPVLLPHPASKAQSALLFLLPSSIALLGLLGSAFVEAGVAQQSGSRSASSKTLAQASAEPAGQFNNQDVIKMVQAGLSPKIIIATIKAQPGGFDLTPERIIALKKAGVDEQIIDAMLRADSPARAGGDRSALREVTLRDGTEITLRLLKPVSSATARVEDRVEFEATEDVLADGVLVIETGSRAWGSVIQARKKKSFGRRGKLDFTIDYVKAVDGQNVRLRATREIQGDDKYGKAGVITLLTGPFGFFVKGKNVDVPAGTEYTIFIDGDRTLKLKSHTGPDN